MFKDNTLSIIDEIKSKIIDIKDRIKEEGVSSTVFGELSKNAKLLQDKLNEILSKTILSQSDIDDAYATLQEVKRNELALLSQRSRNSMILYFVVGGLAIYGVYKLIK
jgi:hypothetical protein